MQEPLAELLTQVFLALAGIALLVGAGTWLAVAQHLNRDGTEFVRVPLLHAASLVTAFAFVLLGMIAILVALDGF